MKLETHTKHFTNPLYLESGRILEPYDLTYETYGECNDDKSNVVVVCHALTGSHHAAGTYENDIKPGWWDGLIGDGKAIDTRKYFVICVNVIGSCFGSTGPMSPNYPTDTPYRMRFPVITISDMVKAQRILFDQIGIHKAHAVIGGSMGGMQALCFPGFATGRMCGHISYLSPWSMQKKFGRDYVETDGLYELFGKFQVERYLDYNGMNFVQWFDPLSFLYITKAINIFDAARNYDSLEDSLSRIRSQIYLYAFSSDMLFLPEEMRTVEETMHNIDKGHLVTYREIESDYGHDAFLVELDKFSHMITEALEE